MKKDSSERRCYNCMNCSRLQQGSMYLTDYNRFFCEYYERQTERNEVCVHWRGRSAAQCDLTPQRFNDVERDIEAIGEYLKNVDG